MNISILIYFIKHEIDWLLKMRDMHLYLGWREYFWNPCSNWTHFWFNYTIQQKHKAISAFCLNNVTNQQRRLAIRLIPYAPGCCGTSACRSASKFKIQGG